MVKRTNGDATIIKVGGDTIFVDVLEIATHADLRKGIVEIEFKVRDRRNNVQVPFWVGLRELEVRAMALRLLQAAEQLQ